MESAASRDDSGLRNQEPHQSVLALEGQDRLCYFEKSILDCVGKALAQFGNTVPQVVLYNLKKSTGVKHDDIPSSPEELEKCLDFLFGTGSRIVKNAIIREIRKRFALPGEYSRLTETFRAVRERVFRIGHRSRL